MSGVFVGGSGCLGLMDEGCGGGVERLRKTDKCQGFNFGGFGFLCFTQESRFHRVYTDHSLRYGDDERKI
uniref:Uncharacterized protein n=1 Tax=Tanacetum cinerariifolium TaxID=118510 RepID=A0A699GQ15_TANCI|nr:hypothetical protein [Tanacetum cinerariifolium]